MQVSFKLKLHHICGFWISIDLKFRLHIRQTDQKSHKSVPIQVASLMEWVWRKKIEI